MLPRFVLIVLLCQSATADGSIILRNMDSGHEELVEYTQVALYMVKRFVTKRTNTLIIMETCAYVCEEHKKFHKNVLLSNLNNSLTIQLFIGQSDDRPWDYNLFIVPSWWDFQSLRFRFPDTNHERQFYFFVMLTWSVDNANSVNSQMLRIFDMCLSFDVKNVVIMNKPYRKDYISFYTYQLFGPDHCQERLTIMEINRYEKGQLRHDVLFPDHMNNFHGCSLTVSAHTLKPLLTFDGDVTNDDHLGDMERLGGIEGDILKLVARTMNLKLQYLFPSETYVIQITGNSSGCFGDLEQNRAHMAVGGLSPLIRNSYKFSYSFAYHTTPYVFVVRGGVFFGPLQQLLYPLQATTWLALLVQLSIAIVVIEIIERVRAPTLRNFVFGRRNKYPIRNLFVALLGTPLPTRTIPKRNFARCLLMAWLLLTFELRNAYQGKMFDSLRLAKRTPIPRKISELIDQDYTLLTARYTDFYPRNNTQIILQASRRLNLLNASERRLTTTVLLDYLAHYNMHHWNTSTLACVDENIYFYQCTLFFNKHSILRPTFDRKFKQLSDAGITTYIAQQHVHSHFYKMKESSVPTDVSQITHQNLLCLYYIYAVMCWVSIVCFVMELLAKRWRNLKRLLDWLN